MGLVEVRVGTGAASGKTAQGADSSRGEGGGGVERWMKIGEWIGGSEGGGAGDRMKE